MLSDNFSLPISLNFTSLRLPFKSSATFQVLITLPFSFFSLIKDRNFASGSAAIPPALLVTDSSMMKLMKKRNLSCATMVMMALTENLQKGPETAKQAEDAWYCFKPFIVWAWAEAWWGFGFGSGSMSDSSVSSSGSYEDHCIIPQLSVYSISWRSWQPCCKDTINWSRYSEDRYNCQRDHWRGTHISK